jgi:hypothetical protein
MKETRAVVLGLVAVVMIAFVWAFFRRPAPGMSRVRALRVEIQDHREGKTVSIRVPGFLMGASARIASRVWEKARRHGGFDWSDSDVTPKEILEAAERSRQGQASVLTTRDGHHVEVASLGPAVRLTVSGEDSHHASIELPRALLERLAQNADITPRELLQRLDEMGPGELVAIHSDDADVRVTAEPTAH